MKTAGKIILFIIFVILSAGAVIGASKILDSAGRDNETTATDSSSTGLNQEAEIHSEIQILEDELESLEFNNLDEASQLEEELSNF